MASCLQMVHVCFFLYWQVTAVLKRVNPEHNTYYRYKRQQRQQNQNESEQTFHVVRVFVFFLAN